MQAREGKLGLRERTRCGHDRNSLLQRPFPCGREQSGLADSSLAANDEGAAAVLDSVDQRVELGQVLIASKEHRGAVATLSVSGPAARTLSVSVPPLDGDSNLQ